MSSFNLADGIAIWKLIYYIPALFVSLGVVYRHGLRRSSTWILLTAFCIVRIVGASATLALLSDPNSQGTREAALICSILGLSPLLMSTLGLISRSFYSILEAPYNFIVTISVVKSLHVPLFVAVVLCIIGGTSANSPAAIDTEATTKAGVIIYAAVFALLCVLTLAAALGTMHTEKGDPMQIAAITFSLPFILVRTIYTLICTFSNSPDFEIGNAYVGSTVISLFMDTLPEAIVVVIYLAAGLMLDIVPAHGFYKGDESLYGDDHGDFGGVEVGAWKLGTASVTEVSDNKSDYAKV